MNKSSSHAIASRVLHRTISEAADLAVHGEGLWLTLQDGRKVIDASGGAAVACLGHGNRRVAEAIGRQAAKLAYVHTGFFTSEPAEGLADLLLSNKPGGLSRAFFVSSGSEAVESALKLARQYFVELGQPTRTRFIARRQSYHGNTLGALALSGNRARRALYQPILSPTFSHVGPCFPYRYRLEGESDLAYVARLEAELEAEFQRLGPANVIAFCAEPVVGATAGCVTAVAGYFTAMRRVCDRHGALLILDEVMCGMGRTGTTHAWEQEGVAPDIQIIGKGLGGGYQAIAGILIAERVVDALSSGSGSFAHGHTYQAHPVACMAAWEVQRIIEEQDLLANVSHMGELLEKQLRARLSAHPNVGDIRGRGLFFAVEFVEDRASRKPFEPSLKVHELMKRRALFNGLAIYPTGGTVDGVRGDHLIVAPAYTAPSGGHRPDRRAAAPLRHGSM